MSLRIQASMLAVILFAFTASSAHAEGWFRSRWAKSDPAIQQASHVVEAEAENEQSAETDAPITQVVMHRFINHPPPQPRPVDLAPVAPVPAGYGQYPVLDAPLYPAPVQYTPAYNGGTIITNQAFAPHEMLYPHRYHAMYPPFYYRVRGGWIWTPFGMRQHEQWKLEGTEVLVNYRAKRKLFSGFHPPRGR